LTAEIIHWLKNIDLKPAGDRFATSGNLSAWYANNCAQANLKTTNPAGREALR